MLLGDFPDVESVFVKDLSYFVESNYMYEHIMGSGLSTYTHTFLIHRPEKLGYLFSLQVWAKHSKLEVLPK